MNLRKYGGMSGFPKTKRKRIATAFDTGHSSTSISAGLGYWCKRREIMQQGSITVVISVIGDGSLTGGMAYEALNNACHAMKSNFIIVLNDNNMSISENVGGMSDYLAKLQYGGLLYLDLKKGVTTVLHNVPSRGRSCDRAYPQDQEQSQTADRSGDVL